MVADEKEHSDWVLEGFEFWNTFDLLLVFNFLQKRTVLCLIKLLFMATNVRSALRKVA